MPALNNSLPAKRRTLGRNSSSAATSSGGMDAARTSSSSAEAATLLMDKKSLKILQDNLAALDVFINRRYMNQLCENGSVLPYQGQINRNNIRLIEINTLIFNEQEDFYEKMISVYSAMNSFGGTIGLMIRSDGSITKLYLCTTTGDTGAELFTANVKGHFPGSHYRILDASETNTLLNGFLKYSSYDERIIRSISMTPGRRNTEDNSGQTILSAQGFEKFVDAMNGKAYTVLILAQSLTYGAIDTVKNGFETMSTLLSSFEKENVSFTNNGSDSNSFTLSDSFSTATSKSISATYGTAHTSSIGASIAPTDTWTGLFQPEITGYSVSESNSQNAGKSQSMADTETEQSGTSKTISSSSGWSKTVNLTRENKTVKVCLDKISECIEEIDQNRSFGMWDCACYVIADNINTAIVASSTLVSLIAGDSHAGAHVYINQWEKSNPRKVKDAESVLTYLSCLEHPLIDIVPQFGGQNIDAGSQRIIPTIMVSGKDLPSIMRLPQRSVSGLVVDNMAEFGRNIPEEWQKAVRRPIRVGNVYHMGEEQATPMFFDLDAFASHCFICGASGSGKSNTTYNLLQEFIDKDIPFLVIEPAKGEYKDEFGGNPQVKVFTTKPDGYRAFRLNPFEFDRCIHIREHISRLLSVVSACWPLHGPTPAMLKEAFERAYIACGWDLDLSMQIIPSGRLFPTFRDVLPEVTKVINASAYSPQAKGDFKGALLTRIGMLLNGFEGEIFGNDCGISDEELFESRTIVDISNIGSAESRALIMGILIIKLREYRSAQQEKRRHASTSNKEYGLKHITILEEAHNILKRCAHDVNQETSNIQGASVGMLVDSIAEMRSCGEGFIIVDQSPSTVDEAAIRNTAIKIVMRLPEYADSQAMANALALTETQAKELTRLPVGIAAVHHVGWQRTMLAHMGEVWISPKISPRIPADYIDLMRTRSALVQWVYDKYIMDELDEMNRSNVLLYIRELRKEVCRTLTAADVDDIMLSMNGLFQRIRSLRSVLTGTELNSKLRYVLGDFTRQFLHIDGLYRMLPITGIDLIADQDIVSDPQKKILRQLTEKGKRKVDKWFEQFSETLKTYMNLPSEAESTQWKIGEQAKPQYYEQILFLILNSYMDDYYHNSKNAKDLRFDDVMQYLLAQGKIKRK